MEETRYETDDGDKRIPVTVDDRERHSGVPKALAATGAFEVHTARLAAGDYLVDNRFLFERKALPDFAASLISGRLFDQALRLTKQSKFHSVLVLEGGFSELRSSGLRREAVLARTLAQGGLPRRGYRPKGKAALQHYILQGLPGVGPVRAQQLLARFGTVAAVLTAEEHALTAVAGIGRDTARKIRWAVGETLAAYVTTSGRRYS